MIRTVDSAAHAVIVDGMTPTQCRAARSMLRWSQGDLAQHSGVSIMTIRNFEAELTTPIRANLTVLTTTLTEAGVEFVGDHGVNLRPSGRPE
jgi:DNA-binding transcriptional regulator YiaG